MIPNIKQRKFTFCPALAGYDFDRLIVECHDCTGFFAACCPHESFGGDWYGPKLPCHQFRLVFTDGACSNNGQDYAKAGLGITIGSSEDYCWSIPVDDAVDPDPARTNQRAELLAAIEGLKKLEEERRSSGDHEILAIHREEEHEVTYIVVTDSEYLVKGITEWFPTWRVCPCHCHY